MRGPFQVSFEEENGVVHAAIVGKMHGCQNFKELLYDPINEFLDRGFRKFVLDLTRVRFLDSIGVGFINMIYTSISNDHGRIVLFGMNERVLSLFHVVRLDRLYETAATRAEALAVLSGTPAGGEAEES